MNILRSTLLSVATVVTLAFTSVPLASAAEPVTLDSQRSFSVQEFIPSLPAMSPTVSVPESTDISFSTPVITSTPAPVVPEPPVIVEAATSQVEVVEAVQQPVIQPAAPVVEVAAPVVEVAAPVAEVAPVIAPEPAAVAPSGVGGALVASAYAQLGVAQDCTAMVENALASIGIITGDIGPSNFFGYGTVVSDPQPGDLMVQGNAHVAIYVGNGMAISGGFNGQNTVLHPISYIGGSAFVRVG